MSFDASDFIRDCAWCGEPIRPDYVAAGDYQTRDHTATTLHEGCAAEWDAEYPGRKTEDDGNSYQDSPEPPLAIYVWREPLCISCGKPITTEEKSHKVTEGFLHMDPEYACVTEYVEAKELQTLTMQREP